MVGSRGVVWVLLCAAAWLPSALAQDVAGAVLTPPDPPLLAAARDGGIDGAGSVIHPPRTESPLPESDDLGQDPDRPVHDDEVDVRLELPTFRWLPRIGNGADFLQQVSLTHLPPGSLMIRYEGVEGVIVRKLERRMRKLWRDSIQDAYKAEMIDDVTYRAAFTDMYERMADFQAGGRWWERSWMDSLVPERGGAPARPYTETIGQRLEVFKLGPLSFTNDLRAHVDSFTVLSVDPDGGQIYRDHDYGRMAREHAHLKRDDEDDPDELPTIGIKRNVAQGTAEPLVRIVLEPPDPGLLPGYWRLRFRPQAAFRLSGDPMSMVKEVSLRVTLELFIGAKRTKFMEIDALVEYEPDDNVGAFGVEISLLTW